MPRSNSCCVLSFSLCKEKKKSDLGELCSLLLNGFTTNLKRTNRVPFCSLSRWEEQLPASRKMAQAFGKQGHSPSGHHHRRERQTGEARAVALGDTLEKAEGSSQREQFTAGAPNLRSGCWHPWLDSPVPLSITFSLTFMQTLSVLT